MKLKITRLNNVIEFYDVKESNFGNYFGCASWGINFIKTDGSEMLIMWDSIQSVETIFD